MVAPAIFAFVWWHSVPRMGPLTIAVDSYGPVTTMPSRDELSTIETIPNVSPTSKRRLASSRTSTMQKTSSKRTTARQYFKATAKPVLIGTAIGGDDPYLPITQLLTQRFGAPD
jgi:K(+)-stimulated pyrophosphate-energized sodium pump